MTNTSGDPFCVEYGWNTAVLWLAGPGWIDDDVRNVCRALAPFRVSVCNPAACPKVWMPPGGFGTVWHQPEMKWWPLGQGATFGSLHALTPRYTAQEAYLRQPVWQWAVHEFGHMVRCPHRPGPNWMYERAPGPPWHPDDIREAPKNSQPMKNIKDHTNNLPVGMRWIDRPPGLGWRVQNFRELATV